MKKTISNMYKLMTDKNLTEAMQDEIYSYMEYLANK